MEGLKDIDLPSKESRRRTTNACVQCQRKKKRCDGGMPRCTSCQERQLECTYLGIRHRGRGKAKAYLERLEAIVGELGISIRHATSAPVGSASNTTSSVETYGKETQFTLSDGLHVSEREATSFELNSRSDDHDKVGAALRDRLFTTFHEKATTEEPQLEEYRDPIKTPVFIQLPPKSHLQSLFEITFAEVNHMAPIFDVPVLLGLLDEQFSQSPTFSEDNYPQRWAMLNTAVAIAIQLRAAKGSESEILQISWAFFKNAFAMYVPIALRGADILALEALLAMAIYMQGSSDLRTTSILVSVGARLALTLGLHRETYYSRLDLVAANRARRTFWACFLLDKDMSTRTALPSTIDEKAMSINHLDLDVSGPSSTGTSHGAEPQSDISSAVSTLLRSSVKLAMLRCSVDKLLFSEYASEQSVHQLLSIVAELEHQLINWKSTLPMDLRLDHINQSTTPMGRQPIILLNFAYYSTLSEIHGFAAHLDHQGDGSMMWQVKTARIAQVSAATEIIHFLQFVSREEQPGYLWCVYMPNREVELFF
ncbi:hypothetical protein AnigIFM63326_003656 [Aspergillus niger]|nr:hypothetical protein AnigIFM63326_003656 [Aspergillus niger]